MPLLFVCICPKKQSDNTTPISPMHIFFYFGRDQMQLLLPLVFELGVFADATYSLALELLVRAKESCQILYYHKQTSSKNVPVKVVWDTRPHKRKVAQEAITITIGI